MTATKRARMLYCDTDVNYCELDDVSPIKSILVSGCGKTPIFVNSDGIICRALRPYKTEGAWIYYTNCVDNGGFEVEEYTFSGEVRIRDDHQLAFNFGCVYKCPYVGVSPYK